MLFTPYHEQVMELTYSFGDIFSEKIFTFDIPKTSAVININHPKLNKINAKSIQIHIHQQKSQYKSILIGSVRCGIWLGLVGSAIIPCMKTTLKSCSLAPEMSLICVSVGVSSVTVDASGSAKRPS